MKYIIFTIALAAGVPFIAFTSTVSSTMKRVFFGLMVVSFLFGSATSINLMSMEYYRGPVRGFEITLADLVAWGLSIGMLLRSGSAIVWRPRFFLPLLAFFLYAAYTVFTADNSILGWFVIWQLLRMGLMYWCTVNFFVTEGVSSKSIRTLVWAYVVTGFLLALITFKQKYVDGIYRAWAFFDHSNTIPSFAVILLCVLLVWLLYDKDVGIWMFLMTLVAALGLVFAIFATGSRTGMVGAGALVVGSLIISNRRNPSLRTKRTTLLILVFMLVGVLFVADTVIDRFMNAPPASEEARNEFELAAIMMADDHKTGVGLNLYSKVLTETQKYREHIAVMRYEEQAGVAHHIYLLTAAEMGYGGMVAFIGLLVLFLGNMVVFGLRWNTLEHRLLLALAMGFAMVCAIGLYEWVLRQSPVLYQTVVALAFGQALVIASSSSGGLSSHE
ncbi:MAG: O-antigen ligase family protein [Sphaerochaetaceae bacterium]